MDNTSDLSCPKCGKWNDKGLQKLKENSKENPIWYKDKEEFKKPVSELIHNLRNNLCTIRGKLHDIRNAYGWDDRIKDAEGGITCIVVALAHTEEEILKFETKQKERNK